METHPRSGTAELPWQVREVSERIGDWIGRLGRVWVEGQIAELTVRSGHGLAYLTLRDSVTEVSLPFVASRSVIESIGSPLTEGAHVVVQAGVEWWNRRGEVKLRALDIRPVGLGELLAVLEARRRTLAAEGLFDDSRKRALPFLPRRVGLICGRGSAAMTDVIENARRRWPAVQFEVREVPVQGPDSAPAVRRALADLDSVPDVDVIVITRGGGAFEDLLPFSDEALVRAVASSFTPVVSAIGHEEDSPLLDLVADVRASTPTDAARRVVPDVREQLRGVGQVRDRMRARLTARLTSETRELAAIRTHPALRDPGALLRDRARLVRDLRADARRTVDERLRHESSRALGRRNHLMALSPQGTLERGFAVVRLIDEGVVVTGSDQVTRGTSIDIRVARGSLRATVTDATPPTAPTPSAAPAMPPAAPTPTGTPPPAPTRGDT